MKVSVVASLSTFLLLSAVGTASADPTEPPEPADTESDAAASATTPSVSPPLSTYVALVASSTLFSRPMGGDFAGPPGDLNTVVGMGRFVTQSLAIELDVGPGFVGGKLGSVSLVPGVVWVFHDHFYAATRFVVPFAPTPSSVAIAPGVGFIHVFKNGLAPVVELNGVTSISRNGQELGASASVGSLYLF
jgi:hypothetical protein